MAEAIGQDCELIELGSGSGLKTRLLLEHLREPRAYFPVDISRRAARCDRPRELARRFPALEIIPVCDDFTGPIRAAGDRSDPGASRRLLPGLDDRQLPPGRGAAAARARSPGWSGAGGGLLIGFDLDKDESIVWPAYNDRRGISAAFNLNLLARINRELDADFDLDAFAHRADYLRDEERVEL